MTPLRVVGVIGKHRDPHLPTIEAVCRALSDLGCEVLFEANEAASPTLPVAIVTREQLAARCQLAVVVGGDGTMLDAGRSLAPAGVPLLGVHQGRLGFMVDIRPESMRDALAAITCGEYRTEDRLVLEARILRKGSTPGPSHTAINDVVLRNQATIRMLEFETWMDDEFISAHRGDGMIVASPTGSTAYALSGGGPLIHPSLHAMSLVPICPHTLSDRPIVVGGDRRIRLVPSGPEKSQAMITIDGQYSQALKSGDVVEVSRSSSSMRLIHPNGYSYFNILRNKLRWGSGPDAPPQRA